MFILQLNTMQKNMARQLQDEQSGLKIVFMERIKNMVIHTSNTLMLTQMELDVRLEHGRY
tara:strand:+ start:304 stop:483 length:180 start_codon:yes stop_codon:yes gene_type:complete